LNIPSALTDSLKQVNGFHEEAFLHAHRQPAAPTSIRLNPRKADTALLELLKADGMRFSRPVPWCPQGRYLHERPAFITDPLFHAGAYYVQEASSMFLEQALRQTDRLSEPQTVLDLCAAPGGKSTHIESLLAPGSLLVSNEVIRSRTGVLAENCSKWGMENAVVTGNAPADFGRLPGFFDVVVADVPCSGSGLFRKDPQAINEWSPEQVLFCSRRQQKIIAEVWPALKTGGLLIYSTCSFSPEENEQVIDRIATQSKVRSLPLTCESGWHIVETESEQHGLKGYRFFPDQVGGEGFYLAVLQKMDETESRATNPKSFRFDRPTRQQLPMIAPFMKVDQSQDALIMHEMELIAFPEPNLEQLAQLKQSLYIKKAGVQVGTVKNRDFIPHADLPLSTRCHPDVPALKLDKERVLNYLRKNPFDIPASNRGWCTVGYGSLRLGWVKILEGRINNHFPANWRILHR
jgi:16S rRNA C967 or C1407 C5-methylase (RsmB/RsmF family)/NOL1/NOP2/fmu family ribosome biogenesis protein